MKKFLDAISSTTDSEEKIIIKLEEIKINLNGKSTLFNNTTILSETVRYQLPKVIAYLIEKRKVDPHESYPFEDNNLNGKNIMAVDIAILALKDVIDKLELKKLELKNLALKIAELEIINPKHSQIKQLKLECIKHENQKRELELKYKKQQDIALYLIKNMHYFSKTNSNFCLPLFYATRLDQLEIVKALIKQDPSLLRSKDANDKTMLHFAAFFNNDDNLEIVNYLLEKHEDGYPRNDFNANSDKLETPYFYSVYNLKPKMMRAMLVKGASSTNMPYAGVPNSSPLRAVCDSIIQGNKISCINTLLAFGAGIARSRIPSGVFTLLKIDKILNTAELLLVGKLDNKNKLLTTVEQVKTFISNPKWKFEIDQLITAAKEPNIHKEPHLPALRQLLGIKESEIQTPLQPIAYQYKPCTDKSKILSLDINELTAEVSSNFEILRHYGDTLEKHIKVCTNINEAVILMDKYLKTVSIIIALMAHKEYSKVKISHFITFEALMNFTFLGFISIIEKKKPSRKELELIYMRLIKILKQHGALLKERSRNFHSLLVSNTIQIGLFVAEDCLGNNNELFALPFLLNMNKIISPVYEQTDYNAADRFKIVYSQEDANKYKIKQLLLLTKIYLNQKSYQDAKLSLAEHFSILKSFPNSNPLIEMTNSYLDEIINSILSIHQNNPTPTSYALLQSCLDILDIQKNSALNVRIQNLKECQDKFLSERAADLMEKLRPFGNVNLHPCILTIDKETHLVNQSTLKYFKDRNPGIVVDFNKNEIQFYDKFILSLKADSRLDDLIAILKYFKSEQDKLIERLAKLALENSSTVESPKHKVKEKTRKNIVIEEESSNTDSDCDNQENNYGFKMNEGYSPAVPITCDAIPHTTYFLSMPLNDKRFTPYLRMIRTKELNSDTYKYHSTKRIPEFGYNQHGVKISPLLIKDNNKQPQEFLIARLKFTDTTDRPYGIVEQEIKSSDNVTRKLFLITDITDKKQEMRSNYKKRFKK